MSVITVQLTPKRELTESERITQLESQVRNLKYAVHLAYFGDKTELMRGCQDCTHPHAFTEACG